MVGIVSQQPLTDEEEAEALVFQMAQLKSVKEAYPQHTITLKCA